MSGQSDIAIKLSEWLRCVAKELLCRARNLQVPPEMSDDALIDFMMASVNPANDSSRMAGSSSSSNSASSTSSASSASRPTAAAGQTSQTAEVATGDDTAFMTSSPNEALTDADVEAASTARPVLESMTVHSPTRCAYRCATLPLHVDTVHT